MNLPERSFREIATLAKVRLKNIIEDAETDVNYIKDARSKEIHKFRQAPWMHEPTAASYKYNLVLSLMDMWNA